MKIYMVKTSGEAQKASSLDGIKLDDCKMVWLDTTNPSDQERQLIEEFFSIHPLAMVVSKRPLNVARAQEFDSHLMVIWYFLTDQQAVDEVGMACVYMIMGANYLVTIHAENLPVLETIFDALKDDQEPKHDIPAFFLYTIMNVSVEQFFPLVEDIQDQVDTYKETSRPSCR
jgi:magnesium transporter